MLVLPCISVISGFSVHVYMLVIGCTWWVLWWGMAVECEFHSKVTGLDSVYEDL